MVRLKSAELFRTVTQGLPIPVLLTGTANGQILYANAMCHPSFGLPPEALVGRSIVDFYADPTQRQTMLKALHRHGTLYDYTLHFRREDGTSFRGLTSLHLLTFNGESVIMEWIYA
jgi:PAS domain S-box-containing protein